VRVRRADLRPLQQRSGKVSKTKISAKDFARQTIVHWAVAIFPAENFETGSLDRVQKNVQ
jgi:hypothetical protein